jgi:hypothetical protein
MTTTTIRRLGAAAFAMISLTTRACDLCGCYTPQLETMPDMETSTPLFPWAKGWSGAVAEQFTRFATAQIDGREIRDPAGQYENSSITQLVAGYSLSDRFALQLNIPLIYREFKRPEGFAIDRGTESGLGDISVLLKSVLFRSKSGGGRSFEPDGKNMVAIEHDPDFTFSAVLLTGLKFPTGDSSRIEEEFHEVVVPGAPPSGIHGHDLTLGTGSYDGIFGGQTSIRYRNFFAEANLQFTLRGDGAHQYHFANELSWSGGPGYYFLRNHSTIVGLEFAVSGEHKDTDRFRGRVADDTGITSVFIGPRLIASRGRWSAEMDLEMPVLMENTAFQVVPDYRIRGGISVHF